MKKNHRKNRRISRFLSLIVSGFCLCGMSACSSKTEPPLDGEGMERKYIWIPQDEAKRMMDEEDGIIIVDVRTKQEYMEEHIPGAVNIPLETITEDNTDLPDKEQTLLLYCRTGIRSRHAAEAFAQLGYRADHLYDFGGITDWPYEKVSGLSSEHALTDVILMLDRHSPAEKDGIILEVTDYSDEILSARFTNESDESFWYGQPFDILVRNGDEWEPVKWEEEIVWTMEAYELQPGETAEFTCSLSLMSDLTSGFYKLVKNDIEAEFCLVYSE